MRLGLLQLVPEIWENCLNSKVVALGLARIESSEIENFVKISWNLNSGHESKKIVNKLLAAVPVQQFPTENLQFLGVLWVQKSVQTLPSFATGSN